MGTQITKVKERGKEKVPEKRLAKEFNVFIAGVGGQGILTLAEILSEAALEQGYDVKMSELHGLAQRGGSIPCQVRFGERVHSSLIKVGHADLIISLEPLEALRAAKFASKGRTTFIINTHKVEPVSVTIMGDRYPKMNEIEKELKAFAKDIVLIDATAKAVELTGNAVMSNIYLLGIASAKNLIPIKREILLEALKESVPEKYFEMNKKVFEAGVH